jgi:DegV family protein with EDD domain
MAERTVAVITDSVCGLDPLAAAHYGVYLLPVRVTTAAGTFDDGVQVSAVEAIAAIDRGENVSTAEPTIELMAQAYRECAEAGASAVVSVHVSGSLSKTVEVARAAAVNSPIPVTIVDTRTTSMGQGFAALAAGAVSLGGGDADQVASVAARVAQTSRVFFTVDTLEYMRRGGRISGVVAAFGTLLQMRPVMSLHDGQVEPIARVRKTSKAREEVQARVVDYAASLRRPVGAVGLVGADAVAEGLSVDVGGPLLTTNPPTSLAIHTGPGMYTACVADMPDEFFTYSA